MSRTSIVLADDHAVVRAGLRLLLEAQEGWTVVGQAGTVAEAVGQTKRCRPDVLVLDLVMPDGSALIAIPAIVRASPTTSVVVLTMQEDPEFARRALREGAKAYVLKDSADEELVEAIRVATTGGAYLTPHLGAQLAALPEPGGVTGAQLTPRETDVLRLIAEGHTNAEIARQLFLSVRTVETHRAHIQRKVRRSRRADLVRYAIEQGLLDVTPAR